MSATPALCVAVIDGDMQHDDTLLPKMLGALQADANIDIAIGLRFVDGGGTGESSAGAPRSDRAAGLPILCCPNSASRPSWSMRAIPISLATRSA